MLEYAAFRGFENIVQFDDDQLIEDPDYFTKARAEAREFLQTAVAAAQDSPRTLREQAERQLRFMDAWARVMPRIEGMWA